MANLPMLEHYAQVEKNYLDIIGLAPGGEYGQNTSWILLQNETGLRFIDSGVLKASLHSENNVAIYINQLRANATSDLILYNNLNSGGIKLLQNNDIILGYFANALKHLLIKPDGKMHLQDNIHFELGKMGIGTQTLNYPFQIEVNNAEAQNYTAEFRNRYVKEVGGTVYSGIVVSQATAGVDNILAVIVKVSDTEEWCTLLAAKKDLSEYLPQEFQAKDFIFTIGTNIAFRILQNGVLKSFIDGYESLVTEDNHFPNRKYLLDFVESQTTPMNAAILLNTNHRLGDGSDHGFINQDVKNTASPTFSNVSIKSDGRLFLGNPASNYEQYKSAGNSIFRNRQNDGSFLFYQKSNSIDKLFFKLNGNAEGFEIYVPFLLNGVNIGTEIAANTIHRSSDGKDHSDVKLNNTHRSSDGKDHSDVKLNNTHRNSNGSDHSYLDQPVTTESSPSFKQKILTGPYAALSLEQTNKERELIKHIGIGESGKADKSLVAPGAVESSTLKGYVKCYIKDNGGQIQDGFYYKPVYELEEVIPTNNLLTDLISYYKCDVNADDSHGNNNGTVNGAVLTTGSGGKIKECYGYDGVDDNIDTGVGIGNTLGSTTNLGISLWFKTNSTFPVNTGILNIGNLGATQGAVGLILYNNTFRLHLNGALVGFFAFTDTIFFNNLVISYDGIKAKVYLNNVLKIDVAWISPLVCTGLKTYLGVYYENGTGINYDGKIDELAIWKRPLITTEIPDLYNSNNGLSYDDFA